VNGERLIENGKVDPFVPYTYRARVLAPIPQHIIRTGEMVIAIRARISSAEVGEMAQRPLLA
jgi:hypothetical protein